MKLFLQQFTAAALVLAGTHAQEQPIIAPGESSTSDVTDSLDLALDNKCVDLGETAAELVVKDNWCRPDGSSSTSLGDWSSNCREAAYSVCKGAIPDVAKDWCSKKKMKTSDLLDLMDKCEDKVDSLVGKPPTSSKSSKSTKKPTRRPTRMPTKKPTSNNKCVDNNKPKAKRNGEKYKFKLERSNAECVDGKNRVYSWGEFKNVKDFSKCADKCVKDVRSSLLSNFQGFNWDCKKKTCRCLYNRDTLDSKNSDRFDKTNRYGDGNGSVRNGKRKENSYCAKLKSVDFVGMNDEFYNEEEGDTEMEARRALRAGIRI